MYSQFGALVTRFRVSPTPWSKRSWPPVCHQNQNSEKIRGSQEKGNK